MSQEVTGWPELPEIANCSHDKELHKWPLTNGEHWEQEPLQGLRVGSLCFVMGLGAAPVHTHYPGSTWPPLTWGRSSQDMGPAGTYTKAMCQTSPPHCCDLLEPMETSGTRPSSTRPQTPLHKQTHPITISSSTSAHAYRERKGMGPHYTNGDGGLE